MPDRVILPRGLPRQYKSVYEQTCEQQNPASIARSAILRLKKDVKEHGSGGRTLIAQISKYLQPIEENSFLGMLPDFWDEIDEKILECTQQVNGDGDFTEWAADACRQIAARLEGGNYVGDMKFEMEKQFYLNVWEGRCAERILMERSHYLNADNEMVRKHISQVKPYIEQEIENLLLGIKPEPIVDLLEVNIMQGDL